MVVSLEQLDFRCESVSVELGMKVALFVESGYAELNSAAFKNVLSC